MEWRIVAFWKYQLYDEYLLRLSEVYWRVCINLKEVARQLVGIKRQVDDRKVTGRYGYRKVIKEFIQEKIFEMWILVSWVYEVWKSWIEKW